MCDRGLGHLAPQTAFPQKNIWLAVFFSMFLHASILHVLGNMLFLWIFGNNVEDQLGPFWFLVLYLVGGIVASLVHILGNLDSASPFLGASGAIAVVMGAYIVWWPQSADSHAGPDRVDLRADSPPGGRRARTVVRPADLHAVVERHRDAGAHRRLRVRRPRRVRTGTRRRLPPPAPTPACREKSTNSCRTSQPWADSDTVGGESGAGEGCDELRGEGAEVGGDEGRAPGRARAPLRRSPRCPTGRARTARRARRRTRRRSTVGRRSSPPGRRSALAPARPSAPRACPRPRARARPRSALRPRSTPRPAAARRNPDRSDRGWSRRRSRPHARRRPRGAAVRSRSRGANRRRRPRPGPASTGTKPGGDQRLDHARARAREDARPRPVENG